MRLQGGLSPDRQGRDVSPGRNRRRRNYRRQSTTMGGNTRNFRAMSPESSSSCSSREPSPVGRSVAPAASASRAPIIRRQSTTEEILIARGFRRQVRRNSTFAPYTTLIGHGHKCCRKKTESITFFWHNLVDNVICTIRFDYININRSNLISSSH